MLSKTDYMNKIYITCIFGLFLFSATTPQAIENTRPDNQSEQEMTSAVEKLELNQLIQVAFESNPAIKAAKSKWEASIERYPQVTEWPDPMLMYSFFPLPLETRQGPQRQRLTLSQKIPYPGKLKLKGDITEVSVEIARYEYEKVVRDVIISLEKSYFELAYLITAAQITQNNQEIIKELARIGENDYAKDVTALNDVLKAQAQSAQLTYDLVLLTELIDTEKTRINFLLNQPPEASLGEPASLNWPGPLPLSTEELYVIAEQNQLELKIAAQKIRRAKTIKKLKAREGSPDFNVNLMYLEVGKPTWKVKPPNAGKDAFGIGFGLNIPLGKDKYPARVREAAHNVSKARFKRQNMLNMTKSKIKQVVFKLHNAERLIQLYKYSLLPQAADALIKAETLYREGAGSYSGLIETQSIWLNFSLAAERAKTDYYSALTELEKLTSVNLLNYKRESHDKK